jgi:glucose/arabinose dehydrogenase
MTVPFPLRLARAGALLLAAGCLSASSFAQEPNAQEPDPDGVDADHRSRVVCAPDNGGITLPPGFCAAVVADQVGLARQMVATPNGSLYVALADSRDGSVRGGVLALRDLDGDGRADRQARFADAGGNGIAYGLGHLFFAQNDRVLRWFLPPWEFVPSASPATVVSGLPAEGDHVNKTVVLHDERHRLPVLFMNIGSASNSCQVENRVPHSPGVDPCPELPIRAGVWRFSAFRRDQQQADGIRFATGTRNMVALAVEPRSDRLWGVQNGRDQLHENWPELYDPEDDLVLPSEEMFRIDRGADYGWPYCYHDPARGMVLAPEYGGDGEMVGRCDDVRGPAAVFPAHWAPLSMLFYTGHQFPARFRRGAFVAFHGSRFDPAAQPAGPGYNVVFVPFQDGRPAAGYEVFADGFAGDGKPLPEAAAHRPVGLAQGPDGSLYISDDKGGRIWRVVFRGGR